MKKILTAVLLCALVLCAAVALVSCAKVAGTYVMKSGSDDFAEITFSGDSFVISVIDYTEDDARGTFEIDKNRDGEEIIVFTFASDDDEKFARLFGISAGTEYLFESGEGYIKIGGDRYAAKPVE